MSIEKNLQTMADNSERIAATLEGILSAISNGVAVNNVAAAPSTTGAEPTGVTSTKDSAAETAAKEELAKAEKAKKAALAKAAKEQATKEAEVEAEKAKNTGDAVSYDSIKAVVTELAGKGPDGITAIKGVLKNYGAAKASDVPKDKWGELLTKFEQAKTKLEGDDGDFA